MLSSAIIVIGQQFSGINMIAFYSSTVFSDAGYSPYDCLVASIGYGLIMFIFAFPAIWTMDTFGRRNLLLFTFPGMALCLLGAGLCFLMPKETNARIPLIAFFIYLFAVLYGPGIGPIPSIYFSEAFPLSHRELGAAFTICINNAVGSALSLTFPSLKAAITPTGGELYCASCASIYFMN
jgi:MFS family permease